MANEAFEGPWIWPNGVVPQAELDKAKAENDRLVRELAKANEYAANVDRDLSRASLEVTWLTGETLAQAIRRVYAELAGEKVIRKSNLDLATEAIRQRDVARADLAEANNRITALTGPDYVAPSLPAVDINDPAHAAFVRAFMGKMSQQHLGSVTLEIGVIYRALGEYADRLEREQAEKAKHDTVIEDVADIVNKAYRTAPWGDNAFERAASALLDRFDITPKAGEAF